MRGPVTVLKKTLFKTIAKERGYCKRGERLNSTSSIAKIVGD